MLCIAYRLAVLVVAQIANELAAHGAIAANLQVALQLDDAPLFQAVGFAEMQ